MNRIFGTTLRLPQTGRFSALAALLALAPLRRPASGRVTLQCAICRVWKNDGPPFNKLLGLQRLDVVRQIRDAQGRNS